MNFKPKKINIRKSHFFIFYLIIYSGIGYGQTLYKDAILPPPSSPSSTCTNTSAVFTSIYNTLPFYIPNASTALKIIPINVNVFRDNNGLNEFPDNATSIADIKQIVEWANAKYSSNSIPSDPVPGVPFIPDTRVRFVLNAIYFYDNTTLNQSTNLLDLLNFIKVNYPERAKQLNIFFTGVTPSPSNPPYAFLPDFGNLDYDMGYIAYPYYKDPVTYYALSLNMAHELGHCLNLMHTYDSDVLNPADINFLDDVFNSTITPGCSPPCYHSAGFGCNPFASGNTCTNNLMGGTQDMGYSSPKQLGKVHKALSLSSIRKYVHNDSYSNTSMSVYNTEVWDFNTRIYSDLNINPYGDLTISCGLTIPYISQIIIGPNGKLTLDNANIVTPYACKGISVENGGCLKLTNTEVNNYNITVKSGGTLIINGSLTVKNASEINVESGGYICFNGTGVNLQDNNNVINLHPGYLIGVNTTYVPAIGTCKAANIVTVTGSGHINTQFSTNLYLQNVNISTNQYYTGSSIFAGSNVTTSIPSGPVKILSTGKVIINAENDIVINSVFEALSGCSFELK